jgi:hypothetical protein
MQGKKKPSNMSFDNVNSDFILMQVLSILIWIKGGHTTVTQNSSQGLAQEEGMCFIEKIVRNNNNYKFYNPDTIQTQNKDVFQKTLEKSLGCACLNPMMNMRIRVFQTWIRINSIAEGKTNKIALIGTIIILLLI